jgi:SAM-dependent methyltransferase
MLQTGLTSTPFVHPLTKEALFRASDGALVLRTQPRHPICPARGTIYDFASTTSRDGDRVHYNSVYDAPRPHLPKVSRTDVMWPWQASPDAELLLTNLGSLDGKRILLLGNGMSLKELHFLSLGARCMYTDLSVRAVQAAQDAFLASELASSFRDRIEFHAVDALHLPFAEGSFDVVYGWAFVHHLLSDLDTLFAEVYRVLRRDGRCCFLDDAYSPVWYWLKRTILRPLQQYAHWKHGISPADRVATKAVGFTRAQVERIAHAHGFRAVFFGRCLFFEYLCTRGAAKLGGRVLLPLFRPLCRRADAFLDRHGGFTRRQGIRLVWGFQK